MASTSARKAGRVRRSAAAAVSLLAALAWGLPAGAAEGTVRDHRTPSPAAAAPLATYGALTKYTVEALRSNPPDLVPRGAIQSLEVEWRCLTCAPGDSLGGITVEIWFGTGATPTTLVGVMRGVTLRGQGGGCLSRDNTCIGVPAGQFPAAAGAFFVKLMREGSVSSSAFNVVPTQLKIFGPSTRDHR